MIQFRFSPGRGEALASVNDVRCGYCSCRDTADTILSHRGTILSHRDATTNSCQFIESSDSRLPEEIPIRCYNEPGQHPSGTSDCFLSFKSSIPPVIGTTFHNTRDRNNVPQPP